MAYEAIGWALQQAINATLKIVLFVLANRASKDRLECWPSLETIAAEASLGKSTVARALSDLERRGLIHRQKGGGVQTTTYTLAVPQRDSKPSRNGTATYPAP